MVFNFRFSLEGITITTDFPVFCHLKGHNKSNMCVCRSTKWKINIGNYKLIKKKVVSANGALISRPIYLAT